jgi:hypothetical protein
MFPSDSPVLLPRNLSRVGAAACSALLGFFLLTVKAPRQHFIVTVPPHPRQETLFKPIISGVIILRPSDKDGRRISTSNPAKPPAKPFVLRANAPHAGSACGSWVSSSPRGGAALLHPHVRKIAVSCAHFPTLGCFYPTAQTQAITRWPHPRP